MPPAGAPLLRLQPTANASAAAAAAPAALVTRMFVLTLGKRAGFRPGSECTTRLRALPIARAPARQSRAARKRDVARRRSPVGEPSRILDFACKEYLYSCSGVHRIEA